MPAQEGFDEANFDISRPKMIGVSEAVGIRLVPRRCFAVIGVA
jgi:hypothetical protein